MVSMTGWLASAIPISEGVLVPGFPEQHAADLLVCPHGALVSKATLNLMLPWEDFGWVRNQPDMFGDSPQSGDRWGLVPFVADRGESGVAVQGVGTYVALLDPLHQQFSTRRNRWVRRFYWGTLRSAVPLSARARLLGSWINPDRATVSALAAVLHDRPELRSRLSDPAVIERLAHDLRRPLAARTWHEGTRRKTFEIYNALRLLRYGHRYGRPFPGDPLPDDDTVVDAISAHIEHSRYTQNVHPSRDDIVRIVRREYLDVEPWPLGALTGDGPSGTN